MPAPKRGTSRWAAIWPNSGTMEIAIRMTSNSTVTPIQIPGLTRNMAQPWRSQSKQEPASTSRLSPAKGDGAMGNGGVSFMRGC
jgi:hypothetical protein